MVFSTIAGDECLIDKHAFGSNCPCVILQQDQKISWILTAHFVLWSMLHRCHHGSFPHDKAHYCRPNASDAVRKMVALPYAPKHKEDEWCHVLGDNAGIPPQPRQAISTNPWWTTFMNTSQSSKARSPDFYINAST